MIVVKMKDNSDVTNSKNREEGSEDEGSKDENDQSLVMSSGSSKFLTSINQVHPYYPPWLLKAVIMQHASCKEKGITLYAAGSNPSSTTANTKINQILYAKNEMHNTSSSNKQSVIDDTSAIKNSEVVIVINKYNRKTKDNFIVLARLITSQTLAKLIRYNSGAICVALDDDRADMLDFLPIVDRKLDSKNTNFISTSSTSKEWSAETRMPTTDRCTTAIFLLL